MVKCRIMKACLRVVVAAQAIAEKSEVVDSNAGGCPHQRARQPQQPLQSMCTQDGVRALN